MVASSPSFPTGTKEDFCLWRRDPTLCDARDGRGGSWSPNGTILFSPDSVGPIYEVSDSGGNPEASHGGGAPRTQFSHRWPSFLPDASHFLYLVRYPGRESTSEGFTWGPRQSAKDDSCSVTSPMPPIRLPGTFFSSARGFSCARPFDTRRLANRQASPLAERVGYHTYRWNGAFSASANDVLAYEGGDVESARLTWMERSGRRLDALGTAGDYGGIRLSPDGRYRAAELRDPATGMIDIWVYEFARGIATRLDFGLDVREPCVVAGRARIAFSSNRGGHWDLYQEERHERGGRGDALRDPGRQDTDRLVARRGSLQQRGNRREASLGDMGPLGGIAHDQAVCADTV